MPKKRQNTKIKTKLPLLVKIIAVLLILFALQILILVFVSLFMFFFSSYEKPTFLPWALNLIFLFIVSIVIIIVAINLFRRKKYARLLAILALFIISILNLRAEFFIADSPAIASLIFNILFLLAALYLLFSKKVKEVFS